MEDDRNRDSEYRLELIPTLTPTVQEFDDPISYLSQPAVMKQGMKYGMVKLVPPRDFRESITNNLSINRRTPEGDTHRDEAFRFRIRKQKLSNLNLLNRCRLSFVSQLESFHMLSGSTPQEVNASQGIDVAGTTVEVYLYDVIISIIKYHNKIQTYSKRNDVDNSGDNSDSEITRHHKKRKRSASFVKEDEHSQRDLSKPRLDIPHPKTTPFLQGHGKKSSVFWIKLAQGLVPGGIECDYKSVSKDIFQVYTQWIEPYLQFLAKYKKYLSTEDLGNLKDAERSDTRRDTHGQLSKFKSNGISILQHNPATYTDYNTCALCDVDFEKKDHIVNCKHCGLNYHKKCTLPLEENNTAAAHTSKRVVCDNCLFGNGCYGFEESEDTITLKEFQSKYCARDFVYDLTGDSSSEDCETQLENEFWSNVNNIHSQLTVAYGADIYNSKKGCISGFENQRDPYITSHPMNLMNLPQANGSLLDNLNKSISGMTIPWIYIGSKFSTFCWHLEDQYTLSCNYQFEGAPKIWYSIPPTDADAFNSLVENLSPDYLIWKHPDLLHQLITLLSPYDPILQNSQINVYKAVQNPGEFIITYPKCYHAGFNTGYNFNEAVNFTLDSWIPFGLEALNNYKKTKKKCVFDMWELIWKILNMATLPKNKTASAVKPPLKNKLKIDNYLVSTCYYELLKYFNTLKRNYSKIAQYLDNDGYFLATTTVKRQLEQESLDSDFEESGEDEQGSGKEEQDVEEEPVCASCNTICSFMFVVKQNKQSRKRKIFRNLHQLMEQCFEHEQDFTILCMDDYMDELNETLKTPQSKEEYEKTAAYNTIYFTKTFHDIEKVLKRAEYAIQKV